MVIPAVKILQFAALAALTGYFLYKCHAQIDKFLEGKTTIAKHMEYRGPQEFPAITVCPGIYLHLSFSTSSIFSNTKWLQDSRRSTRNWCGHR